MWRTTCFHQLKEIMLTLPSTSSSTSGLLDDMNTWMIPPDKLNFQSLFQSLTIDDEPSEIHACSDTTCMNVRNLEKLRIDDSSGLSSDDVTLIVSQSHCLRELSLSYSVLSENLLIAISHKDRRRLEKMKIDVYPNAKPFTRISDEAWLSLQRHSPDLNLILTSHLSDGDDYDALLTSPIPITHLYLSGFPPEKMIRQISENCPRLVELIISSYGSGVIDEILISTAHNCPNLSAIGLGDCDVTCSGLVEFVNICKNRLRLLYIWETSLVEDNTFDVTDATSKVSSLLGRIWTPEFIPPW